MKSLLSNLHVVLALLTLMVAQLACNVGEQSISTPSPVVPALQAPTSVPSQSSSTPIPIIQTQQAPTSVPSQPSSTPTTIVPALQAPTSVPSQPTAVLSKSWVAYASGLATNFTVGDICSLELPFVLKGDALPISSGLVASFTPNSSSTGSYSFSNNILDGECVDSSNGTYLVTFYTASEGDIIMTGPATRVCRGVTVFDQTTETRIAIRERPGSTCP